MNYIYTGIVNFFFMLSKRKLFSLNFFQMLEKRRDQQFGSGVALNKKARFGSKYN
jgi:hypothetical protein